ncbi:MAG: Septum formation protein Maf [Chloroflexi bacterium ADurb.Bin325]|nr:MAG: Septum formation protein Maf [Chloroflexi bacterium ADurb.Bin325]
MTPSLILASRSPRRSQLLAALGLAFAVDVADVDETPFPDEQPAALVSRLCQAKAMAVARRHPAALVLAADTLVALDGQLLGKPADAGEAATMLARLSGRTHQVYTAVCVARDGVYDARLSVSDVTMRGYSDAEIDGYVATGDPLDKAGAYAIQHPQFTPVAAWTGCYAGIMGLPLRLARDMLRDAGVDAPRDVVEACERLSGGRCCARSEPSEHREEETLGGPHPGPPPLRRGGRDF